MLEQSNPFRYYLYALCLALCLAAVHVALIVRIDNTNLATTNGLWKTPDVYRWENGTGTTVDSGGFLYLPAYGYLCRLIPGRAVAYGVHGDVVTYRKLAILNAVFGAFASGAVFLLALRLTGSIPSAFLVSFAHASSAFVLQNSLNSEDVIPAYAFFVASTAFLLEYLVTRRSSFLFLSAIFFALVTLFHWTLMIPGAAAIASVLITDIVRDRGRIRPAVVFFVMFVAVAQVLLLFLSARLLYSFTFRFLSVSGVFFPSKASSGWVGFRLEKIAYALIGIGNYLCGGLNLSNYQSVFADPRILKAMSLSWIYLVTTSAACAWALWSRRPETKIKRMALFGVVVFLVGELENLYSQPQDPQFQIQPMLITVIGLAILLCHLKESRQRAAFRWVSTALALVFTANGAVNLHSMFLTRGYDSQSVQAVRELAELFPPANTVLVSQGFEGWNTWVYVVVYRGDSEQYRAKNIALASAFTNDPGISADEAALLMRKRIEKDMDDGYRVVADTLWSDQRQQFAGSLTTVTDNERAKAFYDLLRPAFDVGRSWDTSSGRFVELRKTARASAP